MNRDDLINLFRQEILIFDGAIGTELYSRHIFTNRCFEEICLSDANLVRDIHRDYLKAGAEVLTTNSYGANKASLKKYGLADKVEAINKAAAQLARECADDFEKNDGKHRLVAGSMAPPLADEAIGKNGQISEADWVAMLVEQGKALLDGGADFLLFETLPTPDTARYARMAMAQLPPETAFILSYAIQEEHYFNENSKSEFAVLTDEALPMPAAIGLNCGVGPDAMLDACELLIKQTNLPVVIQPNAGSPRKVDNRQLYLCSPEYFTTYAVRYANLGARGIGGCCGTNPEHIADMARSVKPLGKKRMEISMSEAGKTVAPQAEVPLAERSAWGKKLANGEWCVSMEMSPPRGWNCEKIIQAAQLCKKAGIDVLNIPDGPRAAPRLSAMVTAGIIQREAGIETVLHVCCRDRNYIGLQADLLGCAAAGLHNLLFITGDPPKLGVYSFASGVFDTDSIGLTRLQKQLNQGIDLGGQSINPPTAAVIGVGADPNAIDFDREIQRLRQKAEAGADYVCTQPIFDIHALEKFAKAIEDLKLPIVAGIWPMANLRNALFMKNEVPGVVVPDWIIQRMSAMESKEDQLKVGIEIARESIAAVKGLVQGVQVSAPLGNVNAALATIQA